MPTIHLKLEQIIVGIHNYKVKKNWKLPIKIFGFWAC